MRAATVVSGLRKVCKRISIHAAHAGSDAKRLKSGLNPEGFQSTLPMRAATIFQFMCCEV